MARSRHWWVCVLMMVSAATASAQGYSWEIAPGDSASAIAEVAYSPGKLKYESANAADPVLIVRLDRRSVLVVNTRRESYAEISFQDWKAIRNQQNAMVVQIPPEIQQLPPDERDRRLQEYVAATNAGAGKPAVIPVQDAKVIQGFPCSKWIVKLENRIVLTVWATRAVKEFVSMRHDLEESFRQLSLNYPSMRYLPDAVAGIDGFPVQYGTGDDMSTVRKLQKRNWGDDEFDPPAGYRKTSAAVPGR